MQRSSASRRASPRASPGASPRASPGASPRASPRESPRASPRSPPDQGVVVSSLDDDTLSSIAYKLWNREDESVRRYVNAHFCAPENSFTRSFTRVNEQRAKDLIFKIFIKAFKEDLSDVEIVIHDEWQRKVRKDNRFRLMFFKDPNLEDDEAETPPPRGGGRRASTRRVKYSRGRGRKNKRKTRRA